MKILTPGSKKRLLDKLQYLTALVREDADRETIMFYAAEIIPAVISELNYYDPMKQPTGRPHKCEGIIDPKLTKRVSKKKF